MACTCLGNWLVHCLGSRLLGMSWPGHCLVHWLVRSLGSRLVRCLGSWLLGRIWPGHCLELVLLLLGRGWPFRFPLASKHRKWPVGGCRLCGVHGPRIVHLIIWIHDHTQHALNDSNQTVAFQYLILGLLETVYIHRIFVHFGMDFEKYTPYIYGFQQPYTWGIYPRK